MAHWSRCALVHEEARCTANPVHIFDQQCASAFVLVYVYVHPHHHTVNVISYCFIVVLNEDIVLLSDNECATIKLRVFE